MMLTCRPTDVECHAKTRVEKQDPKPENAADGAVNACRAGTAGMANRLGSEVVCLPLLADAWTSVEPTEGLLATD